MSHCCRLCRSWERPGQGLSDPARRNVHTLLQPGPRRGYINVTAFSFAEPERQKHQTSVFDNSGDKWGPPHLPHTNIVSHSFLSELHCRRQCKVSCRGVLNSVHCTLRIQKPHLEPETPPLRSSIPSLRYGTKMSWKIKANWENSTVLKFNVLRSQCHSWLSFLEWFTIKTITLTCWFHFSHNKR